MEVTRLNWEEARQRFRRALPGCSLLALDIECTGIRGAQAPCRTDTPAEYYAKMLPVATRFRIIQLGLALFVPVAGGYDVHTFSFYLRPDTQGERLECVFQVSAGAIEFLNGHGGVDYNAWLRHGLAYYNEEQRAKLRGIVEQRDLNARMLSLALNGCSAGRKPVQVHSAQELAEVKTQLAEFALWVVSDAQTPFLLRQRKAYLRQYFSENNSPFEQHRATLLVSELREENGDVTLSFARRTAAEAPDPALTADAAYSNALGFSQLWDELKAHIEREKPTIVGHNSAADLLFIAAALERGLPARYTEGKELLARVFDGYYDTKVLAAQLGLTGSLSELHEELITKQAELPFTLNRVNGASAGYHNAGADAEATGEVFLALTRARGVPAEPHRNQVKLFANKHFHMQLGGPDHALSPHAVVLCPLKSAEGASAEGLTRAKEEAWAQIKALNEELQREMRLIEHYCLAGSGHRRVYFVEDARSQALHPDALARLQTLFTVRTLSAHCQAVAEALERAAPEQRARA